jgi:EAL and modified HD-GYP domain-containing signal transduction protein
VDIFVARQPILDHSLEVYGYELLYRSSALNAYSGTDETLATLQVISNSFFSLDIENLIGRGRAFINFTRELLLSDAAYVLPPRAVVIEVLEKIEVDAEVLAACRRLHQRGYLLAADDIVNADQSGPLLEIVDFIKVDFRAASAAEQERIVRRYAPRACLLAEKVQTRAEVKRATGLGYAFFQGYFFARPAVIKGAEIPAYKLNYLRILSEVNRSELEFSELERLIRREVSVAYKLLRYVNSVLFAQRTTIDSIRRALVILGEQEIRRWVSVILLLQLTVDKPDALAMHSMIRASFCESLAQLSGLGARKSELFLLGLFSLLDAMTDRPLREALGKISLPRDILDTLLDAGPPGSRVALIFHLVKAYERAQWPQVLEDAGSLHLENSEVADAYVKAVHWCDRVFSLVRHGPAGTEPLSEPVAAASEPRPGRA